ncbi:MAG TPA: SDR family NAD(P)-dependent oxidoreductase [Streptomyces sp.]|uniref:SDR family NAD(P)-dependent oxidoreductase n=1 Tax=Streptomyces sp. TaxID=1931 RepID=UPI002D4F3C7D|nr:SDR family NAD(P)-dependent oxidoreductase [Streptomyces sp.]HZG06493.1 SDR family NAD(P)-dependent oxidoreductase [Streptomyces sp.]
MGRTTWRTQVAVVTGAGRGIGRAVVERLADRGVQVYAVDLDAEAAGRTAESVGAGCRARGVDVTEPQALHRLAAEVVEECGRLDLLVNNAGVLYDGRLTDQDPALLRRMVEVNVLGVVNGMQAVLPVMVRQGGGHVITVASATAAKPLPGLAVYSGTKAAVTAMGRALRRELRGTGVRISAVLPYLTDTPAGHGLRAQPGFRALAPEAVAARVERLLERPRTTVYVPGRLRVLLPLLGLLPERLADVLDALLRSDEIALDARPEDRAAYVAELRRSRPSPPGA